MKANQSGVAIVLAMGVAALAALTATAMLVSQSTWSRQVELSADHVQAQLVIQGGLDWARAILSDDRRTSSVDHSGEPWALRLPPIPVENGSLFGHIEDQQGKFNLNNVLKDGKVNLTQLEHFRRLLSILDLPPALADALADWLDADSEPQPQGGAEDETYLALWPPYLAANRPLIDVAELALVRGFDARVRARLRPFVTALPRFTAVNVNTASPEVMSAMVDGLGLDDARIVIAQRERAYFLNVADFRKQVAADLNLHSDEVSTTSEYFIATMRVTIGRAQAHGSALLERESTDWPMIVWRKYP